MARGFRQTVSRRNRTELINCDNGQATTAGTSVLRSVRTGARGDLLLAGKPGGVRWSRLPRILDGLLRRSIRSVGNRARASRDRAVLQLRRQSGGEGAT